MNSEEHDPTPTNGPDESAERNGAMAESGNVDRIRNILFGSQMRDFDGRFQRLDERLANEAFFAGPNYPSVVAVTATQTWAERAFPS